MGLHGDPSVGVGVCVCVCARADTHVCVLPSSFRKGLL